MITFKDLYEAYLRTRKNKRRSADSVQFELHWERNLFQLLEDINERKLQPSAYTFVTRYPKPREVFACSMDMRIIHHYIDLRLRPILEARLTPRSFNNRVGMGQSAAQNQVISDIYEVTRGFTRDAWIIKVDMQGYFPNASQDIAFRQLKSLVEEDYHGDDKEDLLYMIERAIYAFPQNHCYRKSPRYMWDEIEPGKSLFDKPPGIGGAIGHLIWQNTMNYYLNDIDKWIVEELGIHYVRFVDDMLFVVENKEAFIGCVLPELRRRLKEEYGVTMHPKKFYCQHYTKGVEYLGSHIKMDRIYGNRRCLNNAIQRIHQLDDCVCESNVETIVATVNSYLGIFKTRNGYRNCIRVVSAINRRWWKYLEFDEVNVVLRAKSKYNYHNRLIRKYKIRINETARKRRAAPSAQRATA